MGGFAAKQRRRVERQSLQRPQNEFNDNKDDMRLPKKRSLKSTGDSSLRRRSPQQTRSNFMSEPMQRSGNTSKATLPTKTKKVHKPKHLKRKIESISEESTEGRVVKLKEKERLLQQLEEFERRKQQLRQNVQKSSTIMKKVPPIIEDRNIDKIMVKAKAKTRDNHKTTTLTDNKVNDRTLFGETLRTKTKHEPGEVISTISSTSTSGNTSSNVTNQLSSVIVSEHVNHNSINRKDDLSIVHSENDDDISVTNYNTRQRGKRLRRRGTAAAAQNQKQSEDSAPLQHRNDNENAVVSSDGVHDKFKKSSSISPSTGSATSPNDSNGTEEQKQRRCIGRKPVTDFAVGDYYSGTIVYTKPFGIFVDIGCHCDAFCHVSQLSTVFIENPIDTYPVGTKLDEIRVVEIDRKKKRITISLKKEAEREQQEEEKPDDTQTNASIHDTTILDTANPSVCIPKNTSSADTIEKNKIDTKEDGSNIIVDHDNGRIPKIMSPAEQLKRNRKLARRADRRNNQND